MTPQVGIKLGIDGTAKVEGDLKRVSVGLDGIGKAGAAAAGMLASLGAGISIAGLVAFVRNAVDAADEMSKLSQRTGVATKDIAGLQLAFQQSGLGADEFGTTLGRMSRNMVDNAKAFEAMGVKVKDSAGKMRSVRDVLGDVSDKFASYEDGAAKVALANELFGKGADRLIPLLNGGREALEEFDATAQRLGLTMDETTGKQAEKFNDTMELIGLGAQGTARKIAGELLPTMVGLASQFLESMNTGDGFKKVAEGLSVALRGLYIVGLGVVNAFSSVGKTLGAAAGVIASVLKGDFAGARAIMGELRADLTAGINTTIADMGKAWNAASSPAVTALSAISSAVKLHAPEVEKGVKKVAKAAKELKDAFSEAAAKAFTKAMDDFGRISSDAAAKAEALTKTQARLRDVMADPTWAGFSRQQQEQVINAAASAQAAEDWAEAQEAARKTMASAADELKEYNDAQRSVVADSISEATAAEESLRNYGLLRSEVEALKLAKLEEAKESAALAGEDVSNIEKRIAAQRRLVDAVKGMEVKEASTEAAKHAAEEWRKATDQINQSLTDSLMRGFESGKGFARSLRDAVVNMFKTMVLRPVIQAIVQPIAGPIAQGISGVLGGGAGGLGGMIGSLFGAGGLGGSLMAGAGWMTGATTFGGSLAAAGSLIGSGTMGGLMSGLGMAAGALGPIALGAMALHSIFGGKRGGPKVGGISGFVESGIGARDEQGLVGLTDQTRAGLQRSFDEIARSFGATAAASFGVGVSTDPRGDAPTLLAMTAQVNGATVGNFIRGDVGRSEQDLQAAVAQMASRSLLSALRATDLGAAFNEYLRGISLDAPAEVHQAALQTMQTVRQFTEAMRFMGNQFEVVNRLSVEARQRMIEFAGGIDAMVGSLATYFENFYTAEERRIATGQAIARDLSAAGLSLSDQQVLSMSREEFRKLVDSLDLTTESGQRAYAGLVSVAGAFASITESADDLAAAQEMAAQAAAAEVERLADQARAFREAVRGVSDTLRDEVDRLRGVSRGGSQESLWAQFATASAQARAGDLNAAGKLAGLSQSIEEAVRSTASERSEVAAVQERLARSLTQTMGALGGMANSRVNLVPGAGGAPVIVSGPMTGTPSQPVVLSTESAELLKAVNDMADRVEMQQQQLTALMNRLTTTITRWDTDGLPEERVLA